MVHGLYCGYPAGLERTGEAAGLPQDKRKMSIGKALIKYFCVPCKPTKANGGRPWNLPKHAPEKWELFKEYCMQDVVTENEILKRLHLFPMPEEEEHLWQMDVLMNAFGVRVDEELMEGALFINAVSEQKLTEEAVRLTGLANPNSEKQLSAWLYERTGDEIPDMQKATISGLLKRDYPADVRRMLEIRQQLKKTSVEKYVTMKIAKCGDGRIRGVTQFYGAGRTGRWAGRMVQMHAAGQDVETTTSFLEAMANQGYKGSEAGTALAATMRDITQKMEDGAVKIGETSVAVQDSKGNFRDLTDVMADVEKATGGMGDAQKAAALGSTFTADSIKAINMILAEGMDKVSGYEDALRSAGGTAEAMAGTMNDNLTGDMANMNSAFEEMKLQVFDRMEGTLRDGAQYATGTVIPALTEWVPEAVGTVTAGVSAFASAVGPLFETVLKNPRAVVEAIGSITAGFAAFKAVTAGLKAAEFVKGAGGITSVLSKLGAGIFGNPWAAGAAAVTAAVAAIGFAVHEYNKLQIEDSLATQFGDIELSAEQVESAAGHILNTDWLVNVDTSLGKLENADNLAKEAEQALAKNDALEWKCAIGIELTPDEQMEYSNNIQDFVTSQISELEDRTYAARISFSILPETEESKSLLKNIDEWAAKDIKKASKLQSKLTRTVEAALTDGIIDVEEEKAINKLQQKMSRILSRWKEAEAQAEMDWLSEEYSGLSGKDLSSGTFKDLVKELGKQRES